MLIRVALDQQLQTYVAIWRACCADCDSLLKRCAGGTIDLASEVDNQNG